MGRCGYRNKRTGREVHTPKVDHWHFENGRATRFSEYYDTLGLATAAQAAGLSEPGQGARLRRSAHLVPQQHSLGLQGPRLDQAPARLNLHLARPSPSACSKIRFGTQGFNGRAVPRP
jgi:hypothetical protein